MMEILREYFGVFQMLLSPTWVKVFIVLIVVGLYTADLINNPETMWSVKMMKKVRVFLHHQKIKKQIKNKAEN